MPEQVKAQLEPEKKQQLLSVFERLLPLVDGVADKFRLLFIIGLLVSVWLVVWCYVLKHYSLGITAMVGLASALPTLVLARFWWAFEEIKRLPDIAGDMMGDAKSELQASVQQLRGGKIPKAGLLSAGKGLWSMRSLLGQARELLGTYFIGIATVANPFMLILGILSGIGVICLFLIGLALAFFI